MSPVAGVECCQLPHSPLTGVECRGEKWILLDIGGVRLTPSPLLRPPGVSGEESEEVTKEETLPLRLPLVVAMETAGSKGGNRQNLSLMYYKV